MGSFCLLDDKLNEIFSQDVFYMLKLTLFLPTFIPQEISLETGLIQSRNRKTFMV